MDFRALPIKAVADFLMYLFQDKKLQPSTIDGYRSAIADKLGNSLIMSTPLGGGYIIFAFFAVRCPMSGVRRPMSGVTHGFRSFKGKVLELLSPNLVCRLIGSVACLGLLLAVVPLLLTE